MLLCPRLLTPQILKPAHTTPADGQESGHQVSPLVVKATRRMLKALEDRSVPLRSLPALRSAWELWTYVTQLEHAGAWEARGLEARWRGCSCTCDVNVGVFTDGEPAEP